MTSYILGFKKYNIVHNNIKCGIHSQVSSTFFREVFELNVWYLYIIYAYIYTDVDLSKLYMLENWFWYNFDFSIYTTRRHVLKLRLYFKYRQIYFRLVKLLEVFVAESIKSIWNQNIFYKFMKLLSINVNKIFVDGLP